MNHLRISQSRSSKLVDILGSGLVYLTSFGEQVVFRLLHAPVPTDELQSLRGVEKVCCTPGTYMGWLLLISD